MTDMSSRMLAGVSIPDTPLVTRAIEYARDKCEPYLFNHVVRSWLFAARLGQIEGMSTMPKWSRWGRSCMTSR